MKAHCHLSWQWAFFVPASGEKDFPAAQRTETWIFMAGWMLQRTTNSPALENT